VTGISGYAFSLAFERPPLEGVAEKERDAALLEIADDWSSGEFDPEEEGAPINYEGFS
jgi:hypothetical protein